MKITKLIREYVIDEVSKVYKAKLNPYKEQAAVDREKILGFRAELKRIQQEAIDKFVDEMNLMNRDGTNRCTVEASVPHMVWACTEAMVNEQKWEKENRLAEDRKIKEILTALELGATRQDLLDMIAKLQEVESED